MKKQDFIFYFIAFSLLFTVASCGLITDEEIGPVYPSSTSSTNLMDQEMELADKETNSNLKTQDVYQQYTARETMMLGVLKKIKDGNDSNGIAKKF